MAKGKKKVETVFLVCEETEIIITRCVASREARS